MLKKITILLGGNLGDVKKNFDLACSNIDQNIGKIKLKSKLYQSEAWGFEATNPFLNQVIIIESTLSPKRVLNKLLEIEKSLGRIRSDEPGYSSRTLDLDILFIDDLEINTTHLTIPHPEIQNRKFTLLPLVELTPNKIHPKLGKTTSELLTICPDQSTAVAL